MHVYHRFVVRAPGSAPTLARRLEALGVHARPPIFQPLHVTLGLDGFPGASDAYRHALSLPIYPNLRKEEEAAVIRAMRSILS